MATSTPASSNVNDPARPDAKPGIFGMVKQTVKDFNEDNALRLAAAMACYVMLALAPMIVIAFKVMYLVLGDRTRVVIREQTEQLIGAQAGDAIGQMIENANKSGGGTIATIVSLVVVLFSASGVFVSLQDALNTIWEVKPKPDAGWWQWFRKRFLSMGMVLGIAMLLMASMAVTAVLHVIIDAIFGKDRSGFLANAAAYSLDFVVTIAVAWALFMAVFKFLPDVKITWKDVWVGALVTAVLFKLGQIGMAIYFNHGATSAYGTFGSIVAVLLWAYYSSIIMFIGAEFTQVWAKVHGRQLEPEENAVRVTEEDRAQQGIPSENRVAAKAGAQGGAGAASKSSKGGAGEKPYAPRPMAQPVGRPYGPPLPVPQGYVRPEQVRRQDERKAYGFGAAGAAVGAAVAGIATWYLATDTKRPTHRQAAAVRLNERLNAIESKLGRVSRIREYLDRMEVKERIDRVEHEIQRAGRHVRAKETGRPLWMVRLGDLIGGRWSNL